MLSGHRPVRLDVYGLWPGNLPAIKPVWQLHSPLFGIHPGLQQCQAAAHTDLGSHDPLGFAVRRQKDVGLAIKGSQLLPFDTITNRNLLCMFNLILCNTSTSA